MSGFLSYICSLYKTAVHFRRRNQFPRNFVSLGLRDQANKKCFFEDLNIVFSGKSFIKTIRLFNFPYEPPDPPGRFVKLFLILYSAVMAPAPPPPPPQKPPLASRVRSLLIFRTSLRAVTATVLRKARIVVGPEVKW